MGLKNIPPGSPNLSSILCRLFGMFVPKNWIEFEKHKDFEHIRKSSLRDLKKVYKDVSMIDLFVGGFMEKVRLRVFDERVCVNDRPKWSLNDRCTRVFLYKNHVFQIDAGRF